MSIRKLILCGLAVLATAAVGQAGPLRTLFGRGGSGPCPTPAVATSPQTGGGVQAKADAQAQAGRCYHPGGGFAPGASYEGVGYSTVSPQHALAVCCNNGGPVVAQAVSQVANGGYYAVRQYAQAGPVRQAVGGAMVGAGQVVANVGQAVQQPVVRSTSYDGIGVPTDQLVYQPIQVGALLPTAPRVCGPGGCK